MSYRVDYTKRASKQLKKMDRQIAALIISYIEDKLVDCGNPRVYGKPLKGINNIWRYRVGSYRILAKIEDSTVTITVVTIGHRRDIYRSL